ncbi:MAG: leader peptide processing enzyme [Spirochaetaceae bacterium]|jgi:hypothetical protein|nr:leader peptide processing enzyme [Spirochaetaceae bacterium]
MNRRLNTLLFIAGATLLNMALTGGFFFVLFLLYVRFLLPRLPENSVVWGFPLIFIFALAGAFAVYRLLVSIVFSKIKAERYFDPVFKPK